VALGEIEDARRCGVEHATRDQEVEVRLTRSADAGRDRGTPPRCRARDGAKDRDRACGSRRLGAGLGESESAQASGTSKS